MSKTQYSDSTFEDKFMFKSWIVKFVHKKSQTTYVLVYVDTNFIKIGQELISGQVFENF